MEEDSGGSSSKDPKDPCYDATCPYNQAAGLNSDAPRTPPSAANECYHGPGGHSPDNPCGNPDCPYNSPAEGFDADDEDDDLIPCNLATCKAAGGGPYECDHCLAANGSKGTCSCNAKDRGRGQGDRSTERDKKKLEEPKKNASGRGNVQQIYTAKGAPRRRSDDVEPPMEKKEVSQIPGRVPTGYNSSNNSDSNLTPNKPAVNPPPQQAAKNQQPNVPSKQQQQPPQQQQQKSNSPLSGSPPSGKRKRKKRSEFVYDAGDMYPGVHVGHKFCNVPQMNVPKNMGWLWNIKTHVGKMKPRRGWRPGAICKTIAARIEEHRRLLGILAPASQKPSKRRMKKKKDGTYGGYESESEEDLAPKPTLLIKKKDGFYWITMNPLKDPATLEENENPYIDCTPMQFKIATSGAEEANKEDTKSCFCGDDDVNKVPAAPEESDSELDIEFTPPAGIIHPERHRRKRNIVHIDTQYDQNDFLPPRLQLDAKKSGEGKKGKGDKKGKGKKGKGGKKGGKGGGKKKKK